MALELPVPDGLRPALELVDRIVNDVGRVAHTFMENGQFEDICRSDPPAGSRIYWYELLARAHIGGHLSLCRTVTWLSALDVAWRSGNVLLYAAAMRGLLESCADSWFALRYVPMTLATHHYHTLRAIRGKSKRVHLIQEIEDALIHFTHARRLDKTAKTAVPKAHEAMTIQNYLRSLDADYERVAGVYEQLCSLTHPSAESLFPFMGDYAEDTWKLRKHDQRKMVSDMHSAFYDVFGDLLIKTVNLPLILLKLLNTFNEPSLFTPAIAGADPRNIPAWKNIEQAIERSAHTPAGTVKRETKGHE